jgi:hypothetical protein
MRSPKAADHHVFQGPVAAEIGADLQRRGGGVALQMAIVDESSVAEKAVGNPTGAANGVTGRFGDVLVANWL